MLLHSSKRTICFCRSMGYGTVALPSRHAVGGVLAHVHSRETMVQGVARMTNMCRLAIFASHPIQYFTPVYRRLASYAGLGVEVFYYRDYGVRPHFDQQFGREIVWDTDQLSGYSHRFLWNASPIANTFNPLHALNPAAFTHVMQGFDAIWLNGYTYPSNWLALAAASLRGVRVLFRSELRVEAHRQNRALRGIRDRVVRWWIRRADALLWIGKLNRAAYLSYGAPPEKLFSAPYSVDVDRLSDAKRATTATRESWRREFGLPSGVPLILFAGKLTHRKHPEALVYALKTEAMRHTSAHVVYAGSGPEESAVRALATETGVTNVTFVGFVNQQALPRLYALADVFVFPSENEPYGLALNEAMAAGAPPIATTDVGAAADLITEGETGFLIRPGDWNTLGERIASLLNNPKLRAEMSSRATERASQFSFDATAEGVANALRSLRLLPTSASSLPGPTEDGSV